MGNIERALVPTQTGGQEQARPVLGAQPPAPGTTPLRYMGASEYEQNLELVTTQPYFEEEEPPLIDLSSEAPNVQQEQPLYTSQDIDQFLYFISQGNRGYGQATQQPQQRMYQARPPLKCYGCGGDHLVRDCPHGGRPMPAVGAAQAAPVQNTTTQFPSIPGFCKDCSITHLVKDCPVKPIGSDNAKGRTMLNFVDVIPSPQTSETETEGVTIPLRVVTRAQARDAKDTEDKTEKSPRAEEREHLEKSKKKTRRRRPRSQKSSSKKSVESAKPSADSMADRLSLEGETKPNLKVPDDIAVSEVSAGGSVLVEKVNEPFDAIKKAYESRITALTEIPKKLQEYPNPREEKVNLAVHQQKIRETQAMLEGPPKRVLRGPSPLKPSLETIPEVTSSLERGSEPVVPSISREPLHVPDSQEPEPSERPFTTANF